MTHITLTREQAEQIFDAIEELEYSEATNIARKKALTARCTLTAALSAPQPQGDSDGSTNP